MKRKNIIVAPGITADDLSTDLVSFDPTTLADGEYHITKGRTLVYGETFASGDLPCAGYVDPVSGKLKKPKADAAATMPLGTEAFLMVTAGVLNDSKKVMEEGYYRKDSLASGFTKGVNYYISDATAGVLTVTAPTTDGYIAYLLGSVTAEQDKILHFKPAGLPIEVGGLIDLTTDVTGILPPANGGNGNLSAYPTTGNYIPYEPTESILLAAAGGVAKYDPVTVLAAGTVTKTASSATKATSICRGLAVTTAAEGVAPEIMSRGLITYSGWSWTPGAELFVSAAGALTETCPSTSTYWTQRVAYARTATCIEVALGEMVKV